MYNRQKPAARLLHPSLDLRPMDFFVYPVILPAYMQPVAQGAEQ